MSSSVIFLGLLFIIGSHGSLIKTILTERLIRDQGLPQETHMVTTSDDYMLKIYRLPHQDSPYPPVLMVHGMFTSSEDFLITGNISLGNMMHRAGFDVWLINMRFTETARHVSLTRDSDDFWDFGFKEHAAIDVPECIDYIMTKTRTKKVTLVTLSSGSPLYIMMLNERPDMVEKVASYVALAPVYFMQGHRETLSLLRDLMETFQALGFKWNHRIRYGNFKGLNPWCQVKSSQINLCYQVLFWIYGDDWQQVRWDLHEYLFGRYIAYTSGHINYILQLATSGVLAKYDYGPEENLRYYGTEEPPLYDWSTGIAPTIIYYGKNDKVATNEDIKMITRNLRLSKARVVVKQPRRKSFSHFDILVSKGASTPMFEDIIASLKEIYYI